MVKEKRVFFLGLKKQTVAFFPIESTVCAGIYLFSLVPRFSQSQSIPDGITVLFHGNCLTCAGVSHSRADCQTEQARGAAGC